MFDFRDLFQWERFITPSIIKLFYWLAVGISALFGLSGIVSGLTLMALSPLAGLFWILASLIGVVIGVIFARIIAEFVVTQTQVANLKCMTSPSATTYDLPSSRILPACCAPASPPSAT